MEVRHVTVPPGDRDAKVVGRRDGSVTKSSASRDAKPALTPAAARARRYRARKRGEDVPKRKAGRPPATALDLRNENGRLRRELAQARLRVDLLQKGKAYGSVHRAAWDLLNELRNADPERVSPAVLDMLGDVVGAIEDLREAWPR